MNIFSSRGWFARACRSAIAVAALFVWLLASKDFAYLQYPRRPGLLPGVWDYASSFMHATAIVICSIIIYFIALGLGRLFDLGWGMYGNYDNDSDEDDEVGEPQDRL